MRLLTCENLTLCYETGVAVEDVSFFVDAGDYLCVVGENGSGKSTLIKGILGLMQPRRGSIRYEGLKRTEIGYLPQQTPVQRDFPASVWEVVLSGCQGRRGARPFYGAEDKARAAQAMARLGIDKLRAASYRALSGGQQQRVLLSRALCATSRLLLLDEPVTGLDPLAAAEMYALIKQLHAEGVAVIMVSHDVSCALHDATRVLHMGTNMVFFGTAEAYRQSEVGRRFIRCDCVHREEAAHA